MNKNIIISHKILFIGFTFLLFLYVLFYLSRPLLTHSTGAMLFGETNTRIYPSGLIIKSNFTMNSLSLNFLTTENLKILKNEIRNLTSDPQPGKFVFDVTHKILLKDSSGNQNEFRSEEYDLEPIQEIIFFRK